MPKLSHDPLAQQRAKRRAAREENPLQLRGAALEAWLKENVQTIEDCRGLLKELIEQSPR